MLASVSCAVIVGACGSSNSKASGSSRAANSNLALAECMRAHGVPNFPDPTRGSGGEGFSINSSPGSSSLTVDGITFSGPAFQSAVKTCKLFGGGSSPPAISESQKLGMTAKARCMRKHGAPSFPDPTFPASGGVQSGGLGPGENPRSPAVQHAAKACAQVGVPIPGVG